MITRHHVKPLLLLTLSPAELNWVCTPCQLFPWLPIRRIVVCRSSSFMRQTGRRMTKSWSCGTIRLHSLPLPLLWGGPCVYCSVLPQPVVWICMYIHANEEEQSKCRFAKIIILATHLVCKYEFCNAVAVHHGSLWFISRSVLGIRTHGGNSVR